MLIRVRNGNDTFILNSDKIVSIVWNNIKKTSLIIMDNGDTHISSEVPSVVYHQCWEEWQGIFNAVTHAFPNLASPDGIEIVLRTINQPNQL